MQRFINNKYNIIIIYKMKSHMGLNILLCVLSVLGIMFILMNYKEGFLSPGIYPLADDKGLLVGEYKMKENPGLSNYNGATAWSLYPSYAVGSYAQVTNNKKYWPSPCNGYTTPPDMCGGLYQQNKHVETRQAPPQDCCTRVNYYCSH
jgi:hypothetical protein